MNWLDWWLAREGIGFLHFCHKFLVDFIKDFNDRFAFGEASGVVVFYAECEFPKNLCTEVKANYEACSGTGVWEFYRL